MSSADDSYFDLVSRDVSSNLTKTAQLFCSLTAEHYMFTVIAYSLMCGYKGCWNNYVPAAAKKEQTRILLYEEELSWQSLMQQTLIKL